MRIAVLCLAGGLAAISTSALAQEFDKQCAWGLANDMAVKTDCSVSMTREDGKTYCFSSDRAMDAFMQDPQKHMAKARDRYGRT